MERVVVIIIFGLLYGTDATKVELVASRPTVVADESLILTCTYRGNDTVAEFYWKFDGKPVAVVLTSTCQPLRDLASLRIANNLTSFVCPGINSNLFTIERVPRYFHGIVVSCKAKSILSNNVTLNVQSPMDTTEHISTFTTNTTPKHVTATVVDSVSMTNDPISAISELTKSHVIATDVTEPARLHNSTTANTLTTNQSKLNDQTTSSDNDTFTSKNMNISTFTYTTRGSHDEATITKLSTSASENTKASSPTRLNDETTSSMHHYKSASAKVTTPTIYTSKSYDESTSTNEYRSASDTTPKYITVTLIDSTPTIKDPISPKSKEINSDDRTTNVTESTRVRDSTTANALTTNQNKLNDQTASSDNDTFTSKTINASTDTYTTRGSHDEATITKLSTFASENTKASSPTRLDDETTSSMHDYKSASAKVTTPTTYTSKSYDESTSTNEYRSASDTTPKIITVTLIDSTPTTKDPISPIGKETISDDTTTNVTESTRVRDSTTANALTTNQNKLNDQTASSENDTFTSKPINASTETYTTRGSHDETTITKLSTSASENTKAPSSTRLNDETTSSMYDYTSALAKVTTPTTYTSKSYDESTSTNKYRSASETTPKYITVTLIDSTPTTKDPISPISKETNSDYTTTNVTESTPVRDSTTANALTTNQNKLNDQTASSENDAFTSITFNASTDIYITRDSHDEATITKLDTSTLEISAASTSSSTRLNDETTSTNEYTSASAKVTTPTIYTSRLYDETTSTNTYASASVIITAPTKYTSRFYDETTSTNDYTSVKITTPTTYISRFYNETTSTYDITFDSKTTTTSTTYTSRSNYETTGTNDYLSTSEYTTAPTTYVSLLNGEKTSTSAYTHVSQGNATSTKYITPSNDEMTSIDDNTSASDTTTTSKPYISRSNDETARTNAYTYASVSVTKSPLFATGLSYEPTGTKGVISESDYTNAPTRYASRTTDETTGTSDTYASESSIKLSTFANGSTYEMTGTKDYISESECTTAPTTFASRTNQSDSEPRNIHVFVTNTTESKDETPSTNNYTYTSENTTAKSIYVTGSNDEGTSAKDYTYTSQNSTAHDGTTNFKTLITKTTKSNNKTSSYQDYTHAPESTATQTIYASRSNVEISNTDDYKYTSESSAAQTTYSIRPNDEKLTKGYTYAHESAVAQTTQTSAFKYTTASKTYASNPSDKTLTIEEHTPTSKYITSALRTTSPNRETRATTVSNANDTGIVPEVAYRTHCTRNIDSRGTQWNVTKAGSVVSILCFHRNPELSGNISRECTATGTWMLPKYDCVRKAIMDIQNMVSSLKDGPPMAVIDNVLGNLSALTAQKQHDEGGVYSGEIQTVTSILEDIANLDNIKVTHNQAVAFLETASNLLNPSNTEAWQAIDQSSLQNKDVFAATKLLDTVSLYTDVIAQSLNESETEKTIAVANVLLQVRKINDSTEIVFPEGGSYKQFASRTTLYLSRNSLKGSTLFSAVLYRNLSGIMSTTAAFNSDAVLGSAVASAKLNSWKSNNDFKITIMFEHMKVNNLSAVCSFRTEKRKTESTAINVVSILGCSVSTLGLLLTMLAHFIFWRYLKSDRVKILMNLCFALVMSYVIFLCGVDRTENKNGCTIVAVLLHYIYLVVFFLMLAEGIEIFFALIYVFSTKSRLKWILSAAWFIPAAIVGISLAATKRKGYGNHQFCWLSFDNGLIWAFVGPALSIILINSILLGFVIRAIFRSKKVIHKCKKEKALTGIRCLCVLLPLVGCTWIIGIFYVNKSLSWIQYIFSVCNGFQGLVIFIFQCALNKQIRKAYKTVTKRRKSETVSVSLSTPTSKLHIIPKSIAHYMPSAQYFVSCSNGAEVLQQDTYSKEDPQDDEIDNNWLLKAARFQYGEYVPEEDFCTHL